VGKRGKGWGNEEGEEGKGEKRGKGSRKCGKGKRVKGRGQAAPKYFGLKPPLKRHFPISGGSGF